MDDVFLSYARTDREVASNLARALEAQGLTVWWDTALVAGDHFRSENERAIKEAIAVIVIWSPTSVNSDFVRSEAHLAISAAKLIPVSIGNPRLPLSFNTIQTIPLDDWDGDAEDIRFTRILTSLKARGIEAPKEAAVPEPQPIDESSKAAPKRETAESPIFESKPEDARLDSAYIDVFVAYSRRDSAQCEDFILQLRRQELDVFYDQFIRSGESWRASIARHIIGCSVFVVMLSEHSTASAEVRNEINLATTHGKKIIPVFVDDVTLPGDFELMLSGLNYVRAFEDFDRRFLEAAEEAKTLVALDAFNARRALAVRKGSRSPIANVGQPQRATILGSARRLSPLWSAALLVVAAALSAALTTAMSAVGPPFQLNLLVVFTLAFFVIGLPYAILLVHGLKNVIAVASE